MFTQGSFLILDSLESIIHYDLVFIEAPQAILEPQIVVLFENVLLLLPDVLPLKERSFERLVILLIFQQF